MERMYLRKSRADGEYETVEEVLQRHEKMLQEHALKAFGHLIPEKYIYREVVSGETIQDRPMMQQLLKCIQEESISAVLVVDPQRLSRGDLRDCGTVIRAFRYTETIISTPQKNYDLTDKFDRKFLEMELMRGNDYLEYVKEIMLRGRLASVREGNYIGSLPPYGYDKIKVGKSYTLSENTESDVVRLIFDLYVNQNLGCAAICRRLDELGIKPRKSEYWVSASVQEILHNPVYIGKIRWNRRKTIHKYENGEIIKCRPGSSDASLILSEGKHPPLVSEALFQTAQEKRGKQPRTKKETALINIFAGLCRCECGAAMVSRSSNKAQLRLVCSQQIHCRNKSVMYSEYLTEVVRLLRENIPELQAKYETENSEVNFPQSTILANLKKTLQEIENQQAKLYDLLERGIYSETVFTQRNTELAKRRTAAQNVIEAAKNTQAKEINCLESIIHTEDIIYCIENDDLTAKEKNDFLKTVIHQIDYSRKMDTERSNPFFLKITFIL